MTRRFAAGLTAILTVFVGAMVGQFLASRDTTVVADEKPVASNKNTEANKNAEADKLRTNHRQAAGYPSMESPQFNPIAVLGERVFVANTPAGTVDVIDAKSRKVITRIPVGVDPVCIAMRPDGQEVWVANHVSDSVSVIDADLASATHLHVVATVQEFDAKTKATTFDEPVGIAFANNDKAYVALSSENQIAVIDVASRKVTKRLSIPAQDPRAIVVRGERLYVVPFESGNKTQLSGGSKDRIDGDLVTFDAYAHSITNNNVLSIGHVVDLVKHPKVPDRDLFVFDTKTDSLVSTVDSLGTLLYGLAVDSKGSAFVAQTDARNDANGRSGTKKHGLKEMENRAFLNRLTKVSFSDGKADQPAFFDLEPLPPQQPEKGRALATPFAVQVTPDDTTLVVTAAASDKLFTVDAKSGDVLGRVEVGAGPRGVALDGSSAWVLNSLANTVSLVDFTDQATPKVVTTLTFDDPTHPTYKRGRIAFNSAKASTTGTFSCASCHPDGHTDQLLWVLDTPIVTGGNQIMPRSTMPARGLRDTAPYHWDGIPGDPYGGIHSASVNKSVEPNSTIDPPTSTTRHLIDGGLASTMHLVGDTAKNDEGKPGELTAAERDDMAWYLLGVPYPPAPKRAYTNELSERARSGFRLFHIDGDHDPKQLTPNICGNCHRMPFLVSTNTPGTGMDAPTWRGAQDRWLILPQGRLNIVDFNFYHAMAERGVPERDVWRMSWSGRSRFDPIWDMVLEMSTGYSGAFARQVTLSKFTAKDVQIADLLTALERADTDGAVVLECDGVMLGEKRKPVTLQFDAGQYVKTSGTKTTGDRAAFTRADLTALAADGKFVGTLTARHGANANIDHPQPALWTLGPIERQKGRQNFPILHPDKKSMTVSGRHFDDDARVFIDGHRVGGSVQTERGEKATIMLTSLPTEGLHLLQVQVPGGQFSNEFIIHVANDANSANELQRELIREATSPWDGIPAALSKGDLSAVKRLIRDQATANRRLSDGSTPLSTAAIRGHLDVVKYLLDLGADVNATNADGNTPLIVATFMCRTEVVHFLLEKRASVSHKNGRGETAIDVVSGEWIDSLAGFYKSIGNAIGVNIDLDRLKQERPRMANLLRESDSKEKTRRESR
jgi:YVTN family beta-propeller protein